MIELVWMALLVDLVLGDPRWLPHPVAAMGWLIGRGESLLRRIFTTSQGLRLAGVLLTVALTGGAYAFFWGLIALAGFFHPLLAAILQVFFISQCLAIKSLAQHALKVRKALTVGDQAGARQAVALIVGRDTALLDESEVSRAAVESVAESTVDGIISPLFYALLGGAPLAMAFKAVSTLDSSIGYRDERYRDFGWAAARTDDLVNFIPARLAGLCYLFLAPFTAGGLAGVARAMWQDSGRHPSPNSGIPEAATAAALGVQLGGLNYYGGMPSRRALMGLPGRRLNADDIRRSLFLMLAASLLFMVLATAAAALYYCVSRGGA